MCLRPFYLDHSFASPNTPCKHIIQSIKASQTWAEIALDLRKLLMKLTVKYYMGLISLEFSDPTS